MPHHIHTPPQCGFWTGHDPSCFAQNLGAEVDCILIEVGKNKGNYCCIHQRPPETGSGRSGFAEATGFAAGSYINAAAAEEVPPRVDQPMVYYELAAIRAVLRGETLDDLRAAESADLQPIPQTEG